VKTATSLTVIAVGAILAFAVTATPGFLNIQIVGWILMVTGAIGLGLSRNHREWLRRTVIVRGSPDIARTSSRRRTNPRRRPPRQLAAAPAGPARAASASSVAAADPPAPAPPASPNAPTEEFEPVTIEEFTEQ
jgi:hypothetical protein